MSELSLNDADLPGGVREGPYGALHVRGLVRGRQLHAHARRAARDHRVTEGDHVDTALWENIKIFILLDV